MTTAYSYRRFSSGRQASGSSLDRQLEMAKDVCLERGWNLIDLPSDKGISAYKGANLHIGALGKFIEKVKEGQIEAGSVLIVEKMDRFSRDYVDLVLPKFLELLQSGISFYSCFEEELYTLEDIRNRPSTLQNAISAMASANNYSKTLAKRISKGIDIKLQKAKAGKIVNITGMIPRWIKFVGEKGQEGKFIETDHAATVRRIVKEYLQGYSMLAIARRLIADNVPMPDSGKKWRQGSIHAILKSPTLAGDVKLKDVVLKQYIPAMITDDDFNRLQAKLYQSRERRGGTLRGNNILNVFRGIIHCKHCGGHINAAMSPGKKVNGAVTKTTYLKCQNARYGKCDCMQMMRYDEFEQQFFGWHFGVLSDIIGKEEQNKQEEINKLNGQKVQIEKRIQSILSLVDLGLPQVREELQGCKVQLESIDKEIKLISIKETARKSVIDVSTQKLIEDLTNQDNRRQLLNILSNIVDRIDVDLKTKQYWFSELGTKGGPFTLGKLR
jgi:DNA invertase Pin-like site-specific DNA recombinase